MGSETKYTFYAKNGTPICEITGVAELGTVDDRNECAAPALIQLLNQQTFELTLPMKRKDARKLRKLWNGLKPRKEATKKERLEKARKKHKERTNED